MASTNNIKVIKRDGRIVDFDPFLIEQAITKAYKADLEMDQKEELDQEIIDSITSMTNEICARLEKIDQAESKGVEVERIQDEVEVTLMRKDQYSVAKRYILYRADQKKARILKGEPSGDQAKAPSYEVIMPDGSSERFDTVKIRREIIDACKGFEDTVNPEEIISELHSSLYNGIKLQDLLRATVLAPRSRVEIHPNYGRVAERLLLNNIYREVFGKLPEKKNLHQHYRQEFNTYLEKGVAAERLSAELMSYDINRLTDAMKPERDLEFTYLGLQTIYDRYLLHLDERRFETPQYFWMRVAMGLALREKEDREGWAIKFYNMLSQFRFVSSTPTLFNSGTLHPQMSSCYLSTTQDDLDHIYKTISDNARLSKWAGGLGNDWTNIRATGSYIKGTNGKSQGVIPFLKVVNDTAVAVNQGGKRRGAVCAYMETWHLDLEHFLDLRKNTGDDRRRTHDMHTANWIPDLFMKRVAENGKWTLFSPNEVSDLHDLYGRAFEERYVFYEMKARRGEMRQYKEVDAVTLWRKMLSMLFETGHPWITFKDPSNIRSPQDHVGVVHSSNLCTEILLNTSEEETAVCNLGSLNMAQHSDENGLQRDKLEETISVAVRMLDNVIDYNFYPIPEARNANMRHRPVGLGLMGFQDVLYKMRIPFDSDAAVEQADRIMEAISWYAISASSDLAAERGSYSTFKGSKWDRGILPIDSIRLLEKERDGFVDVDKTSTMDWDGLREKVQKQGMRNSNVMAIAPTATISNISGCCQSIEPIYRNLFVKSNLSGDFIQINNYLVKDLEKLDLWDSQMVDDLKYFDGSLAEIERIPDHIKDLYKTAFEVGPEWMIEMTSRRQKWVDMGISLNLYISAPSGKKLNDMYFLAWQKGLKTTYYLRAMAATQVEKASMDINKRGLQPRWMKSKSASSDIAVQREQNRTDEPAACRMDDPECESCQ
jgi:ribonucleoside-diphosphate reductase alpha chain